jgi:RepB DNA-primase N-terminal domain
MRWMESLWGYRNGIVEIRGINRFTKRIKQWFCWWPVEKELINKIVDEHREDYNLFAGVLLRHRKDGTATSCEDSTHWLWADLDKKTGLDFDAVLSSPFRPAMIVDSGHGWHIYWLLEKPLPMETARQAMRSIADKMGGDFVDDPARIMRIPGSINWKDKPIPARLIYYHPEIQVRTSDLTFDYSARRVAPTGGGTGMKGTRSEVLFKAAITWLKQGYKEGDIFEKMLELPEGSKLREMRTDKRREDWVALTLRKARKAILRST